MKKLLASLLVGLVLFVAGCSDRKVAEVKNGVLNFDKTLTVGEAFDNYKYCKNVKWESAETDNGRDFVQVTCDYDIYNKDNSELGREILKKRGVAKFEVIYQFNLLKGGDNDFELNGEFFTYFDKNGKVISKTDSSSFKDALHDLKNIYNNEPLL